MRTVRLLAGSLFGLTLSVAAAAGQKTFEGVITYEMSSGGNVMQIKQMAKGSKFRQELQGPMGQMISLMDTGARTLTTIMPAQKMYMTMDLDTVMAQIPPQVREMQETQPDPVDFEATGRTETIAGHSCEHYTYSDAERSVDLCIATGLGFLATAAPGAPGQAGLPGMDAMEEWRKRFPDGFLPLAMEATIQGQTMTMRATAVELKPLTDDLFTVPEGYTKMNMPGGS